MGTQPPTVQKGGIVPQFSADVSCGQTVTNKPAGCDDGLTLTADFFSGTGNLALANGDTATPLASPLANLATDGCTFAAAVFPRAGFFPAAPRPRLTGDRDSSSSSEDSATRSGDPASGDRDLAGAGLAADVERFLPFLPPAYTSRNVPPSFNIIKLHAWLVWSPFPC